MINLDGASCLPDLVRLLRPAHAGHGAEVSRTSSSATAAACGTRASTRRTPAPISAISAWASISTASSPATPRRPRSSASSRPSRSRRCCSTSTPSCSARAPSIRPSPCQVIFTGDWSLPVKEAEATNALIDQGVDVITCHVDSPKVVVETAEGRGAYICGYHANQARSRRKATSPAPSGTGPRSTRCSSTSCMAGEPLPNFVRGGLDEGFVKMSPLRPGRQRGGAHAVRRARSPRS